jgi:hypothetical protein
MYTLIETARLNDIDPEAWLADVIGRIADHPINRVDGGEANRRAQCGKSACCVRRGGGWKRGTAEMV